MINAKSPPRIIARLDIKGPNVIKGIHLEGLRVVGKPGEMARRYYEQGVDEIIYMDTVASLYGRNNILPVVEEAARDIFVPLTVGGGIRSVGDIVARCDPAPTRSRSIPPASRGPIHPRSGRSVRQPMHRDFDRGQAARAGKWEALTDNGRERTGVDVLDWASQGRAASAPAKFSSPR